MASPPLHEEKMVVPLYQNYIYEAKIVAAPPHQVYLLEIIYVFALFLALTLTRLRTGLRTRLKTRQILAFSWTRAEVLDAATTIF